MIKKEMNPKTKKIVNTTIGLFFATSILFLILLLNSNISKDLVRVLFFMYWIIYWLIFYISVQIAYKTKNLKFWIVIFFSIIISIFAYIFLKF